MFVFNLQLHPDSCQYPVCSTEKSICTYIVLWVEPFLFHYSPKCFNYIQVWRIRQNIEQEKLFFFQNGAHQPDPCANIIKHNERLFSNQKRITAKETHNILCVNGIGRTKFFKTVFLINHSENVEPLCSFRRYKYLFFRKLPSERYIAFCTDMGFVTIIKVYFPLFIKYFKFLQLFGLVLIEPQPESSLWTFSYTFISCAQMGKKRQNVNSLASLPVAFYQDSLTIFTLCLFFWMILQTASSPEQSIIGFHSYPRRVCNPLVASSSDRLTQLRMLWAVISVCSPIRTELKAPDLSNIARQGIQKQWLSPWRKLHRSSFRSDSIIINVLFFKTLESYIEQRQDFLLYVNNYEYLLINSLISILNIYIL